jgi:hypothetical protein
VFSLKQLLLLAALLAGSQSAQSVPLSPEDGSSRIRKWYYSDQNLHFKFGQPWSQIEAIAKDHDLELVKIEYEYEWTQDILLFDLKGRLVETADYPDEGPFHAPFYEGLTRGIYDEESGAQKANRARFSSSRGLKYSYPEGGALISGFFSSGQPYVLTDTSLLNRAKKFIEYQEKRAVSEAELRRLVAEDFQVKPEHLYALRIQGHLDLQILALPGGKILLNDPRLNAGVLSQLLGEADGLERTRLEGIHEIYTAGWTRYYSDRAPEHLRGKPMQEKRLPYDAHDMRILDEIAAQLSKDFVVVRVAGEFHEMDPKVDFQPREDINFFNAFHGRDSKGRYFQLSNSTRGLPSLEKYWKNLIQKEIGDTAAAVYFPGLYSRGAGLDCSGAVSAE